MLEIKIVFNSGYISYFTSATDEEPTEENIAKLRELISNAKQQAMRGSFELKELKTGFITIIDIEEVASFGTRLIENTGNQNQQNIINKKAKKKAKA